MRPLVVFDIETYPNYFLVAFKSIENGQVVHIESREGASLSNDDKKRIVRVLKRYTVIGFNSRNFDIPVLMAALSGYTTDAIHSMAETIISSNTPGWMTISNHGFPQPSYIDHIDIQEPSPGVHVSLKLYGARLHSQRLQDLPIEPGTHLTDEEMDITRDYCVNDLDTTIDLYNAIADDIQLRRDIGEIEGLDVRSKSGAQVAQAVITKRMQQATGKRLQRVDPPASVTYDPPSFVLFRTEEMQDVLKHITSHTFEINGSGNVVLPTWLKKQPLMIADRKYQMGIGGLHSCESAQSLTSNDSYQLIDADVTSYYPSIILRLGLYPPQLTDKFLKYYDSLYRERLTAKKMGYKLLAESYKLQLNSAFGVMGNRYSKMYDPESMLRITITGQLCLLMLIEVLTEKGIEVVSANTDGVVAYVPTGKMDVYTRICDAWQKRTGFTLEYNYYSALHSRDVNNYLAVKTDGTTKGKGLFAEPDLMKNPHAQVAVKAAQVYLTHGVSPVKSIQSCDDIRDFLVVRRVTGGAVHNNQYLGKVVRWYWSTDGDVITYKKNGNKVAKSDGATPCMEIPDSLPDDIDYDRYVRETEDILTSVGVNTNGTRTAI